MTIEKAVHAKYERLTKFLIKKEYSISTMESCTAGLIASLITDTEGSSAIMKGAFVTYSNEAKILQGVPSNIIEEYGVYSTKTAEAMAMACRKAYDSTIGIGVTGTFGNVDLNNLDSVPGEIYIGINTLDSVESKQIILSGANSRFEAKLMVADEIYELLKNKGLSE